MPSETPEQRTTRLARERKRKQRARANVSSLPPKTKKRAPNAERMRKYRDKQTPEKAHARREVERLRQRELTANLSAEQLNHRRRQKAQYQVSRRRPNLCEICGKHFTQLYSLKKHKLIHSGERPHLCDECGKRFTHKGALLDHIKFHNRQKSTRSQERYLPCSIRSQEYEPVPVETISNVCEDTQRTAVKVEELGHLQNGTDINKKINSLNVFTVKEKIDDATTSDNIAEKSLKDTVRVEGMKIEKFG